MRKRLGLLLLLFPFSLFAFDGLDNSGIIPGNIWFSKNPFFAGDVVRIYSALYNSSDATLEGDVGFYDGTVLLGTKRFAVPANGNLVELSYDWKATVGNHSISAKIISVNASQNGGIASPVTLSGDVAKVMLVKVELDSDHDRLSDTQEIALGTDPRKADTDGDGMPDKQEVALGTSPLKTDTDGDGVSDKQETVVGTDPTKADTDGDGAKDGVDTKPLDPHVGASVVTAPATSVPPVVELPPVAQVVSRATAQVATAVHDVTTGSYSGAVAAVNSAVDTVRTAINAYATDAAGAVSKEITAQDQNTKIDQITAVAVGKKNITQPPRASVGSVSPKQNTKDTGTTTSKVQTAPSPISLGVSYVKLGIATGFKVVSASNTMVYVTLGLLVVLLLLYIRRRRRQN